MKKTMSFASSCRMLAYLAAAAAAAVLPLASARAQTATPTVNAVRVTDFLSSIGANSAIAGRGETIQKTIECARYLGLRWFRAGIEGNVSLEDFIRLHREANVRFGWCPGSGGSDLPKLLSTARTLAAAGALLAFEGPNEPNNWGVTYQGEKGGGGNAGTWLPVAKLQRDLYAAVKSDPVLKQYPVFSISENGAETDNVGLQFLTIPKNAGTLMPDGTRFADFANVHNYVYHPNSPKVEDNKTWNAADPTKACRVDGLYGEYGRTWAKHFAGYDDNALLTLPRVTTETGTTIGGDVTEEIHGRNLLTLYLDQFKRGWRYTAVYLLRDRVDEGGNQQFGFYRPDYTPRKAAVYLHNLTTILADTGPQKKPGFLAYAIANEPATVHDLLLQRSDGAFALIVWSERVTGEDTVTVQLGSAAPTIAVYDPTNGITAIKVHLNVKSLPLTLSDHPLVLVFPAKGKA